MFTSADVRQMTERMVLCIVSRMYGSVRRAYGRALCFVIFLLGSRARFYFYFLCYWSSDFLLYRRCTVRGGYNSTI
jgi:hypothetical protein